MTLNYVSEPKGNPLNLKQNYTLLFAVNIG